MCLWRWFSRPLPPGQSINHDPMLDSMTKPYFFSTPNSNPGRSRKLHQIPSGQGTGGAFAPAHEQHTEGLRVRCLPGETLSFNHSTFFLPFKSFKRLIGMMEIGRHCYAALLAFRQWRQPQLTGSLICACHNIVFSTTNHRKSSWKSNGKGQPFKCLNPTRPNASFLFLRFCCMSARFQLLCHSFCFVFIWTHLNSVCRLRSFCVDEWLWNGFKGKRGFEVSFLFN